MDMINSRSRDITAMALDGLYQRSKTGAANISNVATAGYQRKDVAFESQLQQVIEGYELKEEIKLKNSQMWQKDPKEALKCQDPAQIAFMQSDLSRDYSPEFVDDLSGGGLDGNNVVLEEEMMKIAKTGTKYTMLSTLLGKSYQGLSTIIKGQL